MKFIKKFEALLKSTDIKINSNPIIPLADAFENMLKKLAKLDGYEHKIKRFYSDNFYNDNINIKITYSAIPKNFYNYYNLFYVKISSYKNNTFGLTIELYDRFEDTLERRKTIAKRLMNFMEKYVSEADYLYNAGRNKFTIEDIDDIINEIKKIESKIDIDIMSNKYNL